MFPTSVSFRQPSLEELAYTDPRTGAASDDTPAEIGDIRAHDVALGHLNARGFIQFHPVLAQRLDSFKAAIFLGHALFWSRYLAQAQPHRQGWFFMSASQWTEATGLSTHEQTSVRGDLTRRGLLQEALAGRPAVLHYRVNLQATAAFLGLETLSWTSMGELFRSCIRFYKPLSDICGSVSAGLYLSYLLQRQSFALRNPLLDATAVQMFPGEFSYRPDQARVALCLGIKAQRNARERLKAAGFIREGRSTNEVVATRVNLAAIAACLQVQDKPVRKRSGRRQPASVALVPVTVPPPKTEKSAKRQGKAQITALTRQILPQRQMPLFAPMGLTTSQAPGEASASGNAAPDGSVATSAPTSHAANLVRSLFAPNLPASTSDVRETAATTPLKLSTDVVAKSAESALFETPIRPFSGTNLPFFANYKEQGIPRYLQTTTTKQPAVESRSWDTPGRRRAEKKEIGKPETAVNQKIDGDGLNSTVESAFVEQQGVGSGSVEKWLKGPQIQSDSSSPDSTQPTTELFLPEQLGSDCHNAVLATVNQAPPELRQAFLDELAGHLAIPNKTIHNPAGWLHSLIRRQQDGTVILAMAHQVEQQRLRRQLHLQRVAAATSTQQSSELAAASSEEIEAESPVQRTERQRLRELRASFGLPVKKGGSL